MATEIEQYNCFQQSVAQVWDTHEEEHDEKFATPSSTPKSEMVYDRAEKFLTTDMEELSKLSWHGIPHPMRANAWRLLSGYIPMELNQRKSIMTMKQKEYWNLVRLHYGKRTEDAYRPIYRQIHVDVPRTNPLSLYAQPTVQGMLERILFEWAILHPESGYAQGMNDLVTPFLMVFIQELLGQDCNINQFDVDSLPEEDRNNIEADTFWCFSKLLEGMQGHYTASQPGIMDQICQLEDIVQRIDPALHQHLTKHQIGYVLLSFRWMNNLLIRELPLGCVIRLWDTYLSDIDGFAHFHVYVCAAFLLKWKEPLLQQTDFAPLLTLLLNLPTQSWSDVDISDLTCEAYQLQEITSKWPGPTSVRLRPLTTVCRAENLPSLRTTNGIPTRPTSQWRIRFLRKMIRTTLLKIVYLFSLCLFPCLWNNAPLFVFIINSDLLLVFMFLFVVMFEIWLNAFWYNLSESHFFTVTCIIHRVRYWCSLIHFHDSIPWPISPEDSRGEQLSQMTLDGSGWR